MNKKLITQNKVNQNSINPEFLEIQSKILDNEF